MTQDRERAQEVARGIAERLADLTFPHGNYRRALLAREAVDIITSALLSFSEPEWNFDMEAAPKDGTEIEAICQHPHYPYAAEADRHVVRTHWIDHNGGGWAWHGLAGRFIAWRPAA